MSVIKCKAAVSWGPGKLSIQDVEVDPPKVHEVRIKVVAAGFCHTDWQYLQEAEKEMKFRAFPLVFGHEAAGIVESVGPEVSKFSPGDKVIPLFLPQCGECDQCPNPESNRRKTWANAQAGVLSDDTSRISCNGQQVYQFLGVGAFSQYTVVPDTLLAKIKDDAPLNKVCLLGYGVSTGYGAALNIAKVKGQSSCAVFGLGAVGLAAIMGCKAAGAKTIIGVDDNPARREKALLLGATECVSPKAHSNKPIQEVVVEKTDGGVDYALECDGSPAFMNAALASTADGRGTCVIVGWTETETMSVMVEKIMMGCTLKGTYFGGWKRVDDVPKLVEDYMNKKLKLDEFITHNLPLSQINTAFNHMTTGSSIRSVISLWPEEATTPAKMEN